MHRVTFIIKSLSLGFGFLTFETEQCVDNVCGEHFIYINGKQVKVYLEPKTLSCVENMSLCLSNPLRYALQNHVFVMLYALIHFTWEGVCIRFYEESPFICF